jgi:7,8-dihydro-6-hydroxymethylpterin-pyrophosphokinase
MKKSVELTTILKKKESLAQERSQVFDWLRDQLLIRGNQKYISAKLNYTKQFVNQVAKGKKNISDDDLIVWIKLIEDKKVSQ